MMTGLLITALVGLAVALFGVLWLVRGKCPRRRKVVVVGRFQRLSYGYGRAYGK
jgi:hypothetical protein